MGSKVKWVRLGDYIEPIERRNGTQQFGIDCVRGISNTKEIMPTKAKVDEAVVNKFYVIFPDEFIYNPRTTRMGDKVGLAYNYTNVPLLFSFNNLAFGIKAERKDKILPEFLYLYFSRDEFDRYARVNSWGSATELFTYEDLSLMKIPLPSPEEQQKVVNVWKACREIKEQNEAKAAPLMQLCQSYIQELKHKYPAKEIGPYIEECNKRNADGRYGVDELRGVTSEGVFDVSKAKTDGLNFLPYKVVHKGDFAYNPSRINLGSIAMLDSKTCIISPMYVVFRLNKDVIIPEYLSLWFRRKEFHRSTMFYASGSVRDTFDFKEMKNVKIPLPPIDVQRAIVNIYKCANEAKQIAEEADKLSRAVCPALLQHVINQT